MPEWASTLIVLAVLLLVFFGMWAGWRSRARRDAGIVPSHEVPGDRGEALAEASVFYVATTPRDQPLERLAIAGLGFRAHGTLEVHRAGIRLVLAGSPDVWIPRPEVDGAHPAQVTIDKAVEKDGLLTLAWRIGATPVDSYFRVTQPERIAALYDAISRLLPAESEV